MTCPYCNYVAVIDTYVPDCDPPLCIFQLLFFRHLSVTIIYGFIFINIIMFKLIIVAGYHLLIRHYPLIWCYFMLFDLNLATLTQHIIFNFNTNFSLYCTCSSILSLATCDVKQLRYTSYCSLIQESLLDRTLFPKINLCFPTIFRNHIKTSVIKVQLDQTF